jgi:pimeloyl-ACP methyl ester carboxylesterase
MKRGYADTPEGQIHFYSHGRGAALLMLHETPRAAWSFAPLMHRLGGGFRCLAPDTLGFGMSDPLPPKATMEDLARSMTHFLDAQRIEHAHVLGFHTVNKIAAALAAHFPDRPRAARACRKAARTNACRCSRRRSPATSSSACCS